MGHRLGGDWSKREAQGAEGTKDGDVLVPGPSNFTHKGAVKVSSSAREQSHTPTPHESLQLQSPFREPPDKSLETCGYTTDVDTAGPGACHTCSALANRTDLSGAPQTNAQR